MKIRPVFQISLLAVFVLGVYYPTLFAEMNTVDDLKMVNWLLNKQSFDFISQFRPRSSFYYRPILTLTFVLDKYLWGLTPNFLHLGNILLHLANSVLVFLIGRRVFFQKLETFCVIPFACALLFALHPINTESVNWISGRTDLLASFFVLSSCLLLIRAIDLKYPLWALIASLSFLAGIMSKEVVLFFYPAGCFLVWRWPSTSEKVVTFLRLKIIAWFSLPFLGILIWYIAARLERFGGRDVGFNFVFEKYSYDFFNTIRVIFKVLGFYTKKIFLPLPLNFAITSASEHYIWLGLVVLLSLPLLIWLRCIWVDFLLVSFFLMVPGVIIALTNVAWTPLAERYIYLSSAFGAVFACGLVKYIKRYMPDKTWTMYIPVLGVFLMIGVITYQRNQVWQSNLTLFEDTVRKNPGFPSAQNELATALLRAGRNDEARDLWGAAQVEASISNPHQVHFNYVRSLIRDAGFKAAWAAFHNLQNRREIHSLKFLKEDAKICESMLQTFKEEWQEKLIIADLLVIYQKIMKKSSDPFVCYRAGQIAMFNGKPKLAGRYFNEAYQKAPASAHYRAAAEKLADTLKRKGND